MRYTHASVRVNQHPSAAAAVGRRGEDEHTCHAVSRFHLRLCGVAVWCTKYKVTTAGEGCGGPECRPCAPFTLATGPGRLLPQAKEACSQHNTGVQPSPSCTHTLNAVGRATEKHGRFAEQHSFTCLLHARKCCIAHTHLLLVTAAAAVVPAPSLAAAVMAVQRLQAHNTATYESCWQRAQPV